VNKFWETTNKTSELSIESLREMFNFIGSDEHLKKDIEQAKSIANGQRIVDLAFQKGIITEAQAWRLLGSIEINGCLIVNKNMYDKLMDIDIDG